MASCAGNASVRTFTMWYLVTQAAQRMTFIHRRINVDILMRRCINAMCLLCTLRKHAYSNILETLQPKKGKFSDKNSDISHISAQNIDCGYSLEPPRRGGSNEYPQSMFLSRSKKNNVYPCKPQFYYIEVALKGVKIIYIINIMFS